MSGNMLKSLVLVTGIALGVATIGVVARRYLWSRFDPAADLDAGAEELDRDISDDGTDIDVLFVDNEEDDSEELDGSDELDEDQPED